jgi:hypothetical protein
MRIMANICQVEIWQVGEAWRRSRRTVDENSHLYGSLTGQSAKLAFHQIILS